MTDARSFEEIDELARQMSELDSATWAEDEYTRLYWRLAVISIRPIFKESPPAVAFPAARQPEESQNV